MAYSLFRFKFSGPPRDFPGYSAAHRAESPLASRKIQNETRSIFRKASIRFISTSPPKGYYVQLRSSSSLYLHFSMSSCKAVSAEAVRRPRQHAVPRRRRRLTKKSFLSNNANSESPERAAEIICGPAKVAQQLLWRTKPYRCLRKTKTTVLADSDIATYAVRPVFDGLK